MELKDMRIPRAWLSKRPGKGGIYPIEEMAARFREYLTHHGKDGLKEEK